MQVKLVSLKIQELHGSYNYIVHFNPDVTFIYGSNGCGKTTILNITEVIITGQLYKLFGYKFKNIVLEYSPNNHPNIIKRIEITAESELLRVSFEGEEYSITPLPVREGSRGSASETREIYFSRYPFLSAIENTFNYVYLPLNRSTALRDYGDADTFMTRKYRESIFIEEHYDMRLRSKDLAMRRVEELIRVHSTRINSEISKINDEFRNNILKSLLEIDRGCDFETLFKDIVREKNSLSTLQDTKKNYLKMLKELDIVTAEEASRYSQFFDDFIKDFKETKRKGSPSVSIELLLKYQEISKIKELVSLAEALERRKSEIRHPIEVFLDTMNDFIRNSADGKEINIDALGQVYFTTKYSKEPITIQNLSSGEKQLITFFANLIFNVRSNSSGIFVVDEPELSLHLSWQKIFIEKTLSINNNIQLIFATHSPEIIGKHRNKMYKLEKQYVDAGE